MNIKKVRKDGLTTRIKMFDYITGLIRDGLDTDIEIYMDVDSYNSLEKDEITNNTRIELYDPTPVGVLKNRRGIFYRASSGDIHIYSIGYDQDQIEKTLKELDLL